MGKSLIQKLYYIGVNYYIDQKKLLGLELMISFKSTPK